jgi:hypothetical protein
MVKKMLFGVLIITGIVVCSWGFHLYIKAQNSKNWPATNGKFLSSKVESYWTRSGSSRRSRRVRMYRAKVLYEYSVDGIKYTSSKISFVGYNSSKRNEVKSIVDKYPKNKSATVYYDPENPEIAVLQPGETRGIHIPFIIGGVSFLIGFFVLVSKKS